MTSAAPAIRCRGLVKRYGTVVAVDGLDLEVPRGECFGLLGPNGAGKTTTVEILEGLNAPDAGDVEVLGEQLARGRPGPARPPGRAAPGDEVPGQARVSEVLALFRSFYPRGLDVAEVLAVVGLEEKADAPRADAVGRAEAAAVAGVRAGRRPRAAVPRRADDRPRPAVAAARPGRSSRASRPAGRTVLLTTHYMEEAARLCDRVAIVDHGKVIALGTPRELIASLGAEHVVEFAVAEGTRGPDAGGAGRAAQRGRRSGTRTRAGASPCARCTARCPPCSRRWRSAARRPTHLTTHHATLEDVFVALTGRSLRDG